jgi:6-pyruvoyltetrahydropterin/6-carboxytetrahydropterin synthase
LEVEVKGFLHVGGSEDGMIMDFGNLSKIVNERIVDKLDHQWINDVIEETKSPTAEYIVEWIRLKLSPMFDNNLIRIRLYETPDSYAEWRTDEKI